MVNISDYHRLIADHKADIKIYRERKHDLQRKLHKRFFEFNKCKFYILDVAIVLILLFHLGALITTNILVSKVASDYGLKVELKEVNPLQAEIHNLVSAVSERESLYERFKPLFKIFIWEIFWVTLLVGYYVYERRLVLTEREYVGLVFIVLFLLIGTALDFSNNLGWYLGKVLYFK